MNKRLKQIEPSFYWYLRSKIGRRKIFSDLETFCLFIGYPGSGHSLIGAMLDAHPNAIIAHELDVLKFVKADYSRDQIFRLLLNRSRDFRKKGNQWNGYSYHIEGGFQGRYRRLKLIGDKRGGTTVKHLPKNIKAMDRISGFCKNLKIIHMTRNPFDMISTGVIRSSRRGKKISEEDLIGKSIQLEKKALTIQNFIAEKRYDVLTVKLEGLVEDAESELRRICSFLQLEALEDYLENCGRIVFSSCNETRYQLDLWSKHGIASVQEMIDRHQFFNGYSF